MAPTPPPPSLDEFVQKGREKKRNETLAQAIFGQGRPQGRNRPRTPQPSGSTLMNRVTKPGVRTSSTSNINRRQVQGAPFERIPTSPPGSTRDGGISIRGRAGPYVVIGSNFAPGTSDLDIQATMEPIGGHMVSCALLSSRPTVIAEMVFKDKSGADAVVARFNNQIADGRLLHFYHKSGPPQMPPTPSSSHVEATTRATRESIKPNVGSKERSLSEPSMDYGQKTDRFAEPAIQDGTMGFPNSQDEPMEVMEVEREPQPSELPSSDGRSHQSSLRGGYGRDVRNGRDAHNGRNGRYDDRRGYRNDDPRPRDSPRGYESRSYRRDAGGESLYSDRYNRRDYRGGYR